MFEVPVTVRPVVEQAQTGAGDEPYDPDVKLLLYLDLSIHDEIQKR